MRASNCPDVESFNLRAPLRRTYKCVCARGRHLYRTERTGLRHYSPNAAQTRALLEILLEILVVQCGGFHSPESLCTSEIPARNACGLSAIYVPG
jgi:hypothetical protein